MRPAIFWGVMRCKMAIPCRRFGKSYRSHVQGSRIPGRKFFPGFIELGRWERQVVPKRP